MKTQIHGLVLAGGKSERMKKDKALLEYHGKPQIQVAFELLTQFCPNVYLSIREDQKTIKPYSNYSHLIDRSEFSGIGPIGGIISALEFRKTAWIVLACDLPFIKPKTIEYLLSKRNQSKLATAYKSTHDQLPEPLCAIYEPEALEPLKAFVRISKTCPRKFLINHNVELIEQIDTISLDNINEPEEYNQALKKIHNHATKN
jgi:molybdopterin-guanine dinucleotide biosynthesis protein A